MHILMVSSLAGPGPIAGGVWSVARTQAEILRSRGHKVTLFAGWFGRSSPPRQHVDDHFVNVRPLIPGTGIKLPASRKVLRDLALLLPLHDIAHIHLCRDFITTTAVKQSARTDVPTVVQTHGMYGPASSLFTRAFDIVTNAGQTLDIPSAWLNLTEHEAKQLIARGIPSALIRPIFNAVVDPRRTRKSPGVPTFAFLSRLHPRKQPRIFVEAALTVLAGGKRAQFVIGGPDQGELGPILDMINASPYAGSFEYLGALNTNETLDQIAKSTATVLPSLDEPYPMLALESAAIGTPIILTEQSGISKLMRDAGAALIVPPSRAAVAEAMIRVIDAPVAADALASAAQALWLIRWSPAALGTALEEEYRRILNHRTIDS